MAANNYKLVLYSPSGAYLQEMTQYSGFVLSYGERQVGSVSVLLAENTRSAMDFAPFSRLEVWRTVGTLTYLEGERVWYLLNQEDGRDEDGRRYQRLDFYDANYLLEKRAVLAAAESAQALMTDYADDMIKAIVYQTLGAGATDTARTITGLTVAADKSHCTSITKAFHGRVVLDIINEICASSMDAGLYLTYDFRRTGLNTLEFQTYTGQRGSNRGSGSGSPVSITWESGNLENPSLSINRMEGGNYIHATGQGEDDERLTAYKTDDWVPRGFRRLELYRDCRHVETQAALQVEADAQYQMNRPVYRFTGQFVDTAILQYGRDVGYGDIVAVSYGNLSFDCHLHSVTLRISPDGSEDKTILLKNYD